MSCLATCITLSMNVVHDEELVYFSPWLAIFTKIVAEVLNVISCHQLNYQIPKLILLLAAGDSVQVENTVREQNAAEDNAHTTPAAKKVLISPLILNEQLRCDIVFCWISYFEGS